MIEMFCKDSWQFFHIKKACVKTTKHFGLHALKSLAAGDTQHSLTLTWSFEIAINAFILQGGLVKVSLGGIYDVVFHSPLSIFKH